MPYKTLWVNPQRLLTRKGVAVYYTYKNDEADCPSTYWFTTDPDEEREGVEGPSHFDVRDLPAWKDGRIPPAAMRQWVDEPDLIRRVIRAAIDSGSLPLVKRET